MKSFSVCFVIVALSSAVMCEDVAELNCPDNARCIDRMAVQLADAVRTRRTVKVFDLFTIEPTDDVNEGRSNAGSIARFFNQNTIKVDFGQYGVRVKKSSRSDRSAELEIVENRSMEVEGRRRGKRIMQMFLPLILGFKAAGTIIVAVVAVAILTFKAFVASKLALLVTGSMLVKRLMENFGGASPFQSQPYLFSQYPMDFPSTGAHPAYTMGHSTYAAAPEMFGATGAASQTSELLQQHPVAALEQSSHDAAGQYSQPSISSVASPNSVVTQKSATKRWDGLKRKPMYYERPSGDSGYQEYDPYA